MRKSLKWFPSSALPAAFVLIDGAPAQRIPHEIKASANSCEMPRAFRMLVDERVEATILFHEFQPKTSSDKIAAGVACLKSRDTESRRIPAQVSASFLTRTNGAALWPTFFYL